MSAQGNHLHDIPPLANVSPVLSRFVSRWKDRLPHADRDRLLRPLLLALLDTATTPEDDLIRACFALNWLVRVHVPAFLSLTPALAEHAHALRTLPEVNLGRYQWRLPDALHKARYASWQATTPSDWRVIHNGADAAVDAAAGTAAEFAANLKSLHGYESVARDTAEIAAVAAASGANYSNFYSVTWEATIADLQASAQDLVLRMAAVGKGAHAEALRDGSEARRD